jgi:3-dehydroquinate dehydratase-1
LSYHDFEKTPKENELESIFQEIIKKGADIAKVSFYAKNYEDISNLLCVAKKQPIPTITIAMGELGKISRLIGFLFNSVITYCSLEKPFAPGQISIKDLKRYLEYFFPKNSK